MKKAIIFLLTLCVIFTCVAPLGVSALYNSSVKTETEIFYIESLDTGTVLFEQKSNEKASPASLTKIVTAALALKHCEDLNTVITVPEYCIRLLDGTGSSMSGIKVGEEITMQSLLYCLLITSGNEAAMIIADYIGGGSIANFIQMMNDLAKEVGCKNTHFANPHGLSEPDHYTTAQDMAKLTKYAMQFPAFNEITSSTEYTLPATNKNEERKIRTTNFMMLSGYKEYYLKDAKGIKTGSTEDAGKCFITTATRNGYSYLAVAMKAPYYDYDNDGYDENFAFMDVKAMLEWTFDNIKLKTVTDPSQIITVVDVKYAWGVDHVRLVPAEEYYALVPVGVDAGGVLVEPVKDSLPEAVAAPIKKGDEVCEAVVTYAGQEIARIKLVAAEDVDMSVILLIFGKLGDLFRTTVFKVFAVLLALVIVFLIGANIYVNKNRKRNRLKIVNYRDINKKR